MFKVIVSNIDIVIAVFLFIAWLCGELIGIACLITHEKEQGKNGKEEVLRHSKSVKHKSTVYDTARAKSKRKKLSVQKDRP